MFTLMFENQFGSSALKKTFFMAIFQRGLKKLMTKNHLKKVLKIGGTIELTLVDDATIQKINADYRGKDMPTDVVSLSYVEPILKMQNSNTSVIKTTDWLLPSLANQNLVGEIFISVDTAKRQAREHDKTLKEELQFLFAHGLLHVFGYDHEREDERKVMFDLQDEILQTKMWREIIG